MTFRGAVAMSAGVALVTIAGCSQHDGQAAVAGQAGNLARIKQQGVLTVATRNAPTSYYINRLGNPAGPEQSMAAAFAKHLGVKVQYRVEDSIAAVLADLNAGRADIAAAGLTVTAARRRKYTFGPAYQQVKQQVVCRSGGKKPRNVDQLAGLNLEVIGHSSYVERLQQFRQSYPKLSWKTNDKVGTEQLLRRVWKRKIDCTVADSNIVDINRRYYPDLLVMFPLGQPQELAWAMPKGARQLGKAVTGWFAHYRGNGGLAAMKTRYYGFIPKFDFVDKKKLVERIDKRYPKYDRLFARAGKKHNVPPDLLAAQAYQESQWNPHAKSVTGVRGIMMLTKRTARSLGVTDRLNPAQSIRGGAAYLDQMESRLNDDIQGPDRIFFALAAYNVGLAHLRDARKLAERMGKDPNVWSDVRDVLPLLAQKHYYRNLKYGYARGTEPVRYINRIRDYEDVIQHQTE